MQYFTNNLELIKEEVDALNERCKDVTIEEKDKLSEQFSVELLIVNKLLTVEKYLKIKSKFYQERFKRVITNPDAPFVIPKYGIKMTEEEFNDYLEEYNKQFELS